MIKIATIGTNFVVDGFLEAVNKCNSKELVYWGTYSRNIDKARQFGEKYGSTLFFDDINKLAECDAIQAVYIASPTSEHYKQALLMIEHGKHVLLEKPMASNAKEVATLIKTAKDHNVVIMEAVKSVFDDGFRAIKEAVEKVSPIRRVSLQSCQYSSRYDNFKNGIIENAFNPKLSNGALMDIGVYCVHPLVKLFGMPNHIYANAVILPDSIDGEGTIVGEYENMICELTYSKITNGNIPSQIQGEKGTILIDNIQNPRNVDVIYRDKSVEHMKVEKTDSNMIYEVVEWERMILNKDYSDRHTKYSLMSLKIMDEARRQQGIVFPADMNYQD
jgi:predicted dehydrogenase